MNLTDLVNNDLSIRVSDINNHPGLAQSTQSVLVALGILDPPVDGRFGPISRLAMREFVKLTGVGDPLVIDRALATALLDADADALLPVALGTDLASRVVRCMRAKQHWFARIPGYLNIVYIEGAQSDGTPNANVRNHFNDRRIIIAMSNGAPKLLGNWQATTEPGTFYTTHPPNSLGVGRIGLGQYKAWRVGTHTGLSGGGSHEGLLQEVSVDIYRDLNQDFDRAGDFLDRNNDGFNQHHSFNQPENDIGLAGAGCLVGRTIEGHHQFMALVKSDPRYATNHGYLFMTTVVGVADLP